MDNRWLVVIVAVMIAVVVVLQVMPKHYNEATGEITLRKPKKREPSPESSEAESATPIEELTPEMAAAVGRRH